jgi:hypothetical protein
LLLIIAALATWEIIEIWRHSSIMADFRARTELWDNKLGQLVNCPFCLAPWVALWVLVPLLLPEPRLDVQTLFYWPSLIGWMGAGLWYWIVWGFAVARLANLGNDLTHKWCRTPHEEEDIQDPHGSDSKSVFDEGQKQ